MIVEVNGHVFDTDEVKIITENKVTEITHNDRWLTTLTYDRGGVASDGTEVNLDLLD